MEYLQKALTLIREKAYFSRYLNWDELTEKANQLAATPQTPADCYPAIRMLVEALGDHHSFFVGAVDRQTEVRTGTAVGYGVRILSPEWVVVEVFPNTPASRAGILAWDVVEQVNGAPPVPSGERTLPLNPDVPVRLQLRRAGHPFEVELQAAPIEDDQMPDGHYLGDGIGYLELFSHVRASQSQQYMDTAQHIVRETTAAGARGWIVDLRRNRGGNM
jgi:C-terminal processing protease CtpA/Prc